MSVLGQIFPGGYWEDTDWKGYHVPVDIVPIIGSEQASKVAFFIRQTAQLQYRDNTPQQWALMNLAAQIEERISSYGE